MMNITKTIGLIKKYFYILMISFLALFLFLKSPFNQKMALDSISAIELSFISIEFYAYLVWSVLFLSLFRFIRRKFNSMFYPFLLWNTQFFLLTLTYKYGFDIADEGWQLAKSWGFFHGNLSDNADLIWGSSFLNGLWLLIFKSPLMIWSRFAFLLFLPFFGVVIYLILSNFFSKRLSFFSTLISFLLFYRIYLIYNIVNYYYLPVFALLLSFYFLTKYHFCSKNRITHLILSGALAGISIHLKFTFITIIPFFILYVYLYSDRVKNKLKTSVVYYGSMSAALMIGFIVLLLCGSLGDLTVNDGRLSVINMFRAFFGHGQMNSSLSYSFGHLTNKYYNDFASVFKETWVSLLIFASASYSAAKIPKLKYLLVLITVIYMLFSYRNNSDYQLFLFQVVFSAAILIPLFSSSKTENTFFAVIIFCTVFFASFLGSGLSLYTSLISLGFMGIPALALCVLYRSRSKHISFNSVFLSIVIFVFASQFTKGYTPYRDLPSQYLNTMFRSPELFGIYSFKERTSEVDGFMDFSRTGIVSSEKVIFVAMPIFYYLLNVKPVISETHDLILGLEVLKREVYEADPDVIVVPVQSPRGPSWPLDSNKDFWTDDGFERRVAHYYKFYNEYLTENDFKKVFENKMFIVYRKSDILEENSE